VSIYHIKNCLKTGYFNTERLKQLGSERFIPCSNQLCGGCQEEYATDTLMENHIPHCTNEYNAIHSSSGSRLPSQECKRLPTTLFVWVCKIDTGVTEYPEFEGDDWGESLEYAIKKAAQSVRVCEMYNNNNNDNATLKKKKLAKAELINLEAIEKKRVLWRNGLPEIWVDNGMLGMLSECPTGERVRGAPRNFRRLCLPPSPPQWRYMEVNLGTGWNNKVYLVKLGRLAGVALDKGDRSLTQDVHHHPNITANNGNVVEVTRTTNHLAKNKPGYYNQHGRYEKVSCVFIVLHYY
jgi:hypothetical protein